MENHANQTYQSFLVRCWLVSPATADEPDTWRFELREVSGESPKHGFANLEQLHAFISARLADIAADNENESF